MAFDFDASLVYLIDTNILGVLLVIFLANCINQIKDGKTG